MSLDDNSEMPIGKHKGKAMEDVPASYLIWYHENAKKPNGELMAYIDDNLEVLFKEIKQLKR